MRYWFRLGVAALTLATAGPAAAVPRAPTSRVVEHLRILRDLPPLIAGLRELELLALSDKSTDPAIWRGHALTAGLLRAQAKTLDDHIREDRLWFEVDGNPELAAVLAGPCSAVSETAAKNADQLADIVASVLPANPSEAPRSPRAYVDAFAAYDRTKGTLDADGKDMLVAFEKLGIGRASWGGYYDFSLVAVGAAGFWCALLALLLWPGLSAKFKHVFSLPKPASQSVVEPFDAIRGLAALWVFMCHVGNYLAPLNVYVPTSNFLKHGYYALPIFVTMSAFLIFRTVAKVGSWADYGAYYKRRLLRIYPLYFTVLVAVLLCGHFPLPVELGWKRLAAEFFMLRLVGYPRILYDVTWSIYVEEGFYLLIPAWSLAFGKQVRFGAVLSYAAFSVLYAYSPSPEADLLRYFCVGIYLTQVIDCPNRIGQAARWLPLLAAAGILYVLNSRFFHFSLSNSSHLLAVCLFCAMWSAINAGAVNRLLSRYPLRFLGIISYSIYMWHKLILMYGMPIRYAGPAPAYFFSWFPCPAMVYHASTFYLLYPAAVLFYASASFALIERPFLLLRERAMPRSTASAGVRPENAFNFRSRGAAYAVAAAVVLGALTWIQMKERRDMRESAAAGRADLGVQLVGQGKTDEAIAQLNLALQADPNLAKGRYDLGLALARAGRMDEAIAQYVLAIQADPGFVEARTNLGSLLAARGKNDEAIMQYTLAIQAKPDAVITRYNFGNLLSRLGRRSEAVEQYTLAVRYKPDFSEARSKLDDLLKKPDSAGGVPPK